MLIPYGGLSVNDGSSGTLALTTTAALLNCWSATGGNNAPSSGTNDGDPAIIPDKANNRIKLGTPGVYRIDFDLSGTLGAAAKDLLFQLRKNSTVVADLTCRASFSTTRANASFSGFLTVAATDNPKTIGTFADPSSTGFAGAGAAPLMEVPIDIVVSTISSTETLTIEAAHLSVTRVG